MRRYDFIFSLGSACSCSQSLREAGLQFASYPFDWVGSPGIMKSVAALESEFSGWFEKDDLKLIDVRREPLSTRCFINRKTGFAFYHEFTLFKRFDDLFPKIAERFARRGRRLLAALRAARSVLAVYVEVPFRETESVADFAEARRRVAAKFPNASVDLLVFCKAESGKSPEVLVREPGLTIVKVDFVQYEGDVMSHQVNRTFITQYLKENFSVADRRSEEDRRRFAAFKQDERSDKWGEGLLPSRLLNELSYKLYRKLERYLVRNGLVPRERPVRY